MPADLDGARVVARLFNADHAVLAESAPITLSVGEKDGGPTAAVEVAQDAERYPAGSKAAFTARVRNAGGDHTVSWSVRQNAENPFTEIPGRRAPRWSTPCPPTGTAPRSWPPSRTVTARSSPRARSRCSR
ncbi:hypothetical protein NKH77_40780 [Streptomyces sp. M19]